MQLAELDAPGTEYALQRDRYSPVSRATLVGIVKLDRDEDSVRPKSRRYAEMMVTDGPFALNFEDARDKANWKKERTVRVSGKVILSTWEDYERYEADQASKRETREGENARAGERHADFRRRVVALGVAPAAADDAMQRTFGRWSTSHLLVEDGVLFALLEKAEGKRGTFLTSKDSPDARRLVEAGMPDGYRYTVTTEGAPTYVPPPDGSMRHRTPVPMGAHVELTRDGALIGVWAISLEMANDGNAVMMFAIEKAKDNAAHEHELAS